MARIQVIQGMEHGPDFTFYCPGCGCDHGIWTKQRNDLNAIWEFNGDLNSPTFIPSLKITYPTEEPHPQNICHSFIRNGNIEYLGDCTHQLAGKTIQMEDIEE